MALAVLCVTEKMILGTLKLGSYRCCSVDMAQLILRVRAEDVSAEDGTIA